MAAKFLESSKSFAYFCSRIVVCIDDYTSENLSQYGVICKRGEGNTNSERQVCSEPIITPLLIASSLSHTAYRSRRSEDQRASEEGLTL